MNDYKRRSFDKSLLPLFWDKSKNKIQYEKPNRLKRPKEGLFSTWLYETLIKYNISKKQLIDCGINRGTLRHWFICVRHPRNEKIYHLCTVLEKLTKIPQREFYIEALKITKQGWLLKPNEQ